MAHITIFKLNTLFFWFWVISKNNGKRALFIIDTLSLFKYLNNCPPSFNFDLVAAPTTGGAAPKEAAKQEEPKKKDEVEAVDVGAMDLFGGDDEWWEFCSEYSQRISKLCQCYFLELSAERRIDDVCVTVWMMMWKESIFIEKKKSIGKTKKNMYLFLSHESLSMMMPNLPSLENNVTIYVVILWWFIYIFIKH